jgi:hypothetical protein
VSYLAYFQIGTKEYVKAQLTSDRTLGAQTVEVKVGSADAWRPAQWTGSAGLTNTLRTSSLVDFTSIVTGAHHVYVRFTDSPEIPIVDVGQILVSPIGA